MCSIVFSIPDLQNLTLNMTTSDNLVTDNLTCNYNLNDTATSSAISWYKNNTPTMLLYMPFEGNSTNALIDRSGNGNNGKNVSGKWNSSGGYGTNGAYYFYLSGTYTASSINITGLLGQPSTLSFSAWINPLNLGGGKEIISLGNRVVFRADDSIYGLELYFYNYTDGAMITNYSTSLSRTGWRFVAFTISNITHTQKIYLDGVEVSSNSYNADIKYTGGNQNTFIANHGNGNSRAFNGTIDEVRVYNSSLSAEQILALYNNRTDLIVSQELAGGDIWQCRVTPFNTTMAGTLQSSNNITIGVATSSDSSYPQFFSYWDNNKTIIDSGVGIFNVSVNNTNGTVKLEINGGNITMTNRTRSDYNATFTFSYGKVYTYKYWSYGNGTSQFINVSPTMNYQVNISCIINGTVSLSNAVNHCANLTFYTGANLTTINVTYRLNNTMPIFTGNGRWIWDNLTKIETPDN
jgi:hypothetical protein